MRAETRVTVCDSSNIAERFFLFCFAITSYREFARARFTFQAERREWISAISEALNIAKEKAANDLLGKSAIEHLRSRVGHIINCQHFQVKAQEGWCERKRASEG